MIKINEKNERIHEINEGIWNVSYDCNMGSKLVTSNSFVPDPGGAKGRSQMNGFQQNPRKNSNLGNFEILKKRFCLKFHHNFKFEPLNGQRLKLILIPFFENSSKV